MDNSSNLHKEFLQFFESSFGNIPYKEEVNVQELCPDYSFSSHHFDFYCQALNLIVELHGKQHYEPATFGGIGKLQAKQNFARQSYRDNVKWQAATNAGYFYIAFAYNDDINILTFTEKLNQARAESLMVESPKTATQIRREEQKKQRKEYVDKMKARQFQSP